MTPFDWIKALLGKGIVEPIAVYYGRKQELNAAKFQAELAATVASSERHAQLIRDGLTADATWELEQIRSSGWKSEYVLIVLSIPLVGCFIPGLSIYVLDGFAILNKTPQWYQWLIMMIFAAVYGIRLWRRNQSDT